MPNAPYTGGFASGPLFAVDGDLSVAKMVGNPTLSYPFRGDSIVSARSIAVPKTNATFMGHEYITVPVGTFPNIQPFGITQSAAIIEMKMVVAFMHYQPLLLNTRLDTGLFNQADFVTNYNANNVVELNNFFLVAEDQFEEQPGGIVTFRRVYASIPITRNIPSQIGYKFPGLADAPYERLPYTKAINCRVQHDYYIYDPENISELVTYHAGGPRLTTLDLASYFENSANPYLTLTEQLFRNGSRFVEVDYLTNAHDSPSVPTQTQWLGWYGDVEIVAEGSFLSPWMGNIYERITKFVLAL